MIDSLNVSISIMETLAEKAFMSKVDVSAMGFSINRNVSVVVSRLLYFGSTREFSIRIDNYGKVRVFHKEEEIGSTDIGSASDIVDSVIFAIFNMDKTKGSEQSPFFERLEDYTGAIESVRRASEMMINVPVDLGKYKVISGNLAADIEFGLYPKGTSWTVKWIYDVRDEDNGADIVYTVGVSGKYLMPRNITAELKVVTIELRRGARKIRSDYDVSMRLVAPLLDYVREERAEGINELAWSNFEKIWGLIAADSNDMLNRSSNIMRSVLEDELWS